MTVIEAPAEYAGSADSLFLAGGISNAENWQRAMISMLSDTDLVLLNPRRARFATDDPAAGEQQIRWEHRHIRRATAVAFWFPPQTLCPIALYELGSRSEAGQTLFVGVDPGYRRRFDVIMQTRLARPEVEVMTSLEALAAQVRQHFSRTSKGA